MDNDDNPAVIVEIAFAIQGRSRDDCIARADGFANSVLAAAGGEPWMMLDDDWQRIQSPQYTIADDQGFIYQGRRRYQFTGPFVGSKDYGERPGHRTQGYGE